MGRLADKVAIVTGAGTGIGQGIALAFAAEGANVVAVGRRLEKVQETADLIVGNGGHALALSVDVSKAAEVARMAERCAASFGPVDVLVNNAAGHVPKGILDVSEEQWDWIMSVNLKGVFLCCKAVVPAMIERGRGRIVNVASIAAITPTINAAYCASKGGVVALTKSMALDLSPKGITVNAICPGPIVTDMTRARFSEPVERAYQLSKARVGFLGEPSDVGAAAVYVASDEARFVTGSVLVVDGGWTIS